jgi:hypothetical protein
MTPPATGSINVNGSGGWTPPDTSQQRLQLDNLLRRELKVGDPSDARQVAQALLTRFQGTARARQIEQEARGLPYLPAPVTMPTVSTPQGSSSAELRQGVDDVERDLQELTTNTLLKDVTPELQGWAQAVRSAVREGTNAARFGLDSRQRDKAMAIRRQLGDYARLARLVGALTPTMSPTYRKFAQSLDEVAAIILVMLGESLANMGFSGGQFLLQVPFSELQVRRDAVIYGLRNLVGSTQEAYGQSEWPRGLNAYLQLYKELETQGQGDLRSLLVEVEISRVMDELIQRAAHGNPEGLRALGATAELDLERFRRLVAIGQTAALPESPPLATFLLAVQLFAEAFARSGGFRLLRIARPPILSYGLYGMSGLSDAESRLIQLVIQRNRLADLLDCYLECGCSSEHVLCQILLDKILYDTDRAIDLYAFGVADFGEPEQRAAAYAFVIEAFERLQPKLPTGCLIPITATNSGIGATLHLIREQLIRTLVLVETNQPTALHALTVELLRLSLRVRNELVAQSLCPAGQLVPPTPCAEIESAASALGVDVAQPIWLPTVATVPLFILARLYAVTVTGRNLIAPSLGTFDVPLPLTPLADAMFGALAQELCAQRHGEERWARLVESMAPSCLRERALLDAAGNLAGAALALVGGTCPPPDLNIPPDSDTSLDNLVNGTTVTGIGRWPGVVP